MVCVIYVIVEKGFKTKKTNTIFLNISVLKRLSRKNSIP